MTTLTLSIKAIDDRVHSLHFLRTHWKLVYAMGVAVILLLLISYTFLVNQITGQAYLIKNDSRTLESIAQENKSLEISFAKSDFLANIIQRAADLNFQKTANITYVQILENSLAQAK